MKNTEFGFALFGGDEEDRTLYLLTASQALSQVSYAPMRFFGLLDYNSISWGVCKDLFSKKFG